MKEKSNMQCPLCKQNYLDMEKWGANEIRITCSACGYAELKHCLAESLNNWRIKQNGGENK